MGVTRVADVHDGTDVADTIDIDGLRNATPTPRARGTEERLDELDPDTRTVLLQFLDNRDLSAATVARTLTDHGFPLTRAAVHGWRSRNR